MGRCSRFENLGEVGNSGYSESWGVKRGVEPKTGRGRERVEGSAKGTCDEWVWNLHGPGGQGVHGMKRDSVVGYTVSPQRDTCQSKCLVLVHVTVDVIKM